MFWLLCSKTHRLYYFQRNFYWHFWQSWKHSYHNECITFIYHTFTSLNIKYIEVIPEANLNKYNIIIYYAFYNINLVIKIYIRTKNYKNHNFKNFYWKCIYIRKRLHRFMLIKRNFYFIKYTWLMENCHLYLYLHKCIKWNLPE